MSQRKSIPSEKQTSKQDDNIWPQDATRISTKSGGVCPCCPSINPSTTLSFLRAHGDQNALVHCPPDRRAKDLARHAQCRPVEEPRDPALLNPDYIQHLRALCTRKKEKALTLHIALTVLSSPRYLISERTCIFVFSTSNGCVASVARAPADAADTELTAAEVEMGIGRPAAFGAEDTAFAEVWRYGQTQARRSHGLAYTWYS